MKDTQEKHLRVFEDRIEYYVDQNIIETYYEGTISDETKKRVKRIKEAFTAGFLDQMIDDLREGKAHVDTKKVSDTAQTSLNGLVDSMTSEVGRALIGLSVMQLCIKSIVPEQNIRLHKGSSNRGSFSWVEGISMRTLDKNFVTPVLRKHNLLKLNAYGFMMTRSLAENYPYTSLYKANLRGAKEHWLNLVEELEAGVTEPTESLKFLLSKLLDAAADFSTSADRLIEIVKNSLPKLENKETLIHLIERHLDVSDYAARLLEVSMHALMQAAVSTGALGDLTVKPLSQMRSANKKHGNVGDIELVEDDDIIEAWDAKYGKSYLREEIEEAVEKLQDHSRIHKVGFVTNIDVDRTAEIGKRIADIQSLYLVEFTVLTFEDWVGEAYQRCLSNTRVNEKQLSHMWLQIYAEYLGQKRRDQAPIDEPCLEWITDLTEILRTL